MHHYNFDSFHLIRLSVCSFNEYLEVSIYLSMAICLTYVSGLSCELPLLEINLIEKYSNTIY